MTDAQSFLFDFNRVEDFFEQWNLAFKLSDMNSSNNFQLIFCTDSPNNIKDCLLAGGGLDTNAVTIAPTATENVNAVYDCGLKWENNTISIRNSVTWNIGETGSVPLKAVFLRSISSNYIMGYCIHTSPFDVTNQVIFDAGTVLWRIYDD